MGKTREPGARIESFIHIFFHSYNTSLERNYNQNNTYAGSFF